MQRLIDANALNFEKLQDTNGRAVPMNDYIAFLTGAMAAQEIVKKAPTIDAEPVVRCKDCEHWNKENRFNGNAVVCKCEWFSSYHGVTEAICTHMNDFCSYGAKMDKEAEQE